MYSLPYFKENDPKLVLQFMRAHPFAMLCGCDASGLPVATQIPFLIEEPTSELIFEGHFMRKTDHHRAFTENPNALIVFTGPHEYVSASWYSNPAQASTWNYMSVHARGRLEFVDDASLLNILSRTTAHFENDANSPASFQSLPREYISKLSTAIIGFKIVIEEIDNVFKLSQNRDKMSYETIIEKLNAKGGDAAEIASEMKKRSAQLFPGQQQA